MKKIGLILIKIIVILSFSIFTFSILSKIFIPKWLTTEDNMVTYIVKGFYDEPKNSLDVLFMGNSDVYRGVSPIVLWDEYGIASYAYSSPGQRMWTSYYLLLDALRVQKPQVIFLNADAFFYESDSGKGNYHKAFDNMEFSLVKLQAITDPTVKVNIGTRLSYIFPVFYYHSRYNELTKEDFDIFNKYHFAYKGLDLNTDVVPYENGNEYMEDNTLYEIGPKALKYLNKFVEKCKKENIELIIMEVPSADSWSKVKSDVVKQYADKNNLKFIDLNLKLEEINFDWTYDTSDGGDHLNVYGAEKVSAYLGKYLDDNYNLSDYRNYDKYKLWHEDNLKYHKDKENLK